MGPLAKRLPHMVLLSVLFVLVGAGCAHQPTPDDYRRIESDNALSPAQKDDAIVALSHSSGFSPVQAGVLAVGVVLLVGALIARRRTTPTAAPAVRAIGQRNPPPAKSVAKPVAKSAAKPVSKAAGPTPGPGQSPYRAQQEAPVERLPESQKDVDAIPAENRGVSFFTSRPLPLNRLAEVAVVVGEREHVVLATPQEADQVAAGQTPRIRAFTVGGSTVPWYAWERYDPYRDYWTAMKQEWRGFSDGAIACTIAAEDCPPRLTGYFASEDNDQGEDESHVDEAPEVDNTTGA